MIRDVVRHWLGGGVGTKPSEENLTLSEFQPPMYYESMSTGFEEQVHGSYGQISDQN